MKRLKIPNGLSAVGYTPDDIPRLVEGALPPQQRVIKLSPWPVTESDLHKVFKNAMVYW
jgi:hydroxyacid-oxoacid transhydrogenase